MHSQQNMIEYSAFLQEALKAVEECRDFDVDDPFVEVSRDSHFCKLIPNQDFEFFSPRDNQPWKIILVYFIYTGLFLMKKSKMYCNLY